MSINGQLQRLGRLPLAVDRGPRVMVRILTRGQPAAYTINRMFELAKKRPDWDLCCHINPYSVSIGRNEICRQARQAQVDFLIMIDDDVVPGDRLLALPGHDKPVVAGLVPIWQAGYFLWNAHVLEEGVFKTVVPQKEGLMAVHAIGTGILCLRRDVLEDERLQPPFQMAVDEAGCPVEAGGEDTYFSLLCHRAGIPRFIDCQLQAEHWRPVGLKQSIQIQQQHQKDEDFQVPTPFGMDAARLPAPDDAEPEKLLVTRE